MMEDIRNAALIKCIMSDGTVSQSERGDVVLNR